MPSMYTLCMYVCMYVYMYVCMYVYMYVRKCGWMDGWRAVRSKAVSEECSRDSTKLAIWCNVKLHQTVKKGKG